MDERVVPIHLFKLVLAEFMDMLRRTLEAKVATTRKTPVTIELPELPIMDMLRWTLEAKVATTRKTPVTIELPELPVVMLCESIRTQLNSFYDELELGRLRVYNYRENSATPISLLRKGVIKPKEGEPQHRVDTAKPQALKELEDSVEEKLKSSEDSSHVVYKAISVAVSLAPDIYKASQKGVSLEEIEETLQQKAQALQKKGEIFSRPPKPTEAKQTPAFSEIARWKSKEKSGPASKYLQDNYGHLLKRYNRELDRDLICLQDIKAHDKTLWRGLYSEAKKTGIKPSEYVASKSQRTKEAALDTDIGKLREFEREAARQRQAMRRHGISLESLKNKP